jgi:hypothetical protein
MIEKKGPIKGSLVSKGRFITFIPDILYSEKPDSIDSQSVGWTPIPLREKGLTGFEKYPFLGKKKENDMPSSCEDPLCGMLIKTIRKIMLALTIVFL